MSFAIEPLAATHDRSAFMSGNDEIDRYLQTQASQDARRRIANCFVATPDSVVVAGYYTLSAASVPLGDLAPHEIKRLPRYPVLPAALVGRLAVDRQFHRRGLGAALLYDALARSMQGSAAVYALVVDAKDAFAVAFYRHFGFTPFVSRPTSLYLPLATAAKLT